MDSSGLALLQKHSGDAPLYVRFFDVDYSAGYGDAAPVGDFLQPDGPVGAQPLVPVVFLTNRVFERLSREQIDTLAVRVGRKIDGQLKSFARAVAWQWARPDDTLSWEKQEAWRDSFARRWSESVAEIQMDCDWTAGTRESYFYFLRRLNERTQPRRLSCTVRLHQYRDRAAAGVPPVSRGLLMCYNVGDPRRAQTENAVLDAALVKGYVKGDRYPLPLDVALPLFSWGAWFTSDGQFRALLAGWDERRLADTALFHPEGAGRYRLRRDTVIGSDYLREGDVVRLDHPPREALLQVTGLVRDRVKGRDSRLVFFDFDPEKIRRHEKLLEDCVARWR
jgi:hypothetical protein